MKRLSFIHFEVRQVDLECYSRIPGWETQFIQCQSGTSESMPRSVASAPVGALLPLHPYWRLDPFEFVGRQQSLNAWVTLAGLRKEVHGSDALMVIEPYTFLARDCAIISRELEIPLFVRTHTFLNYLHTFLPPYVMNQRNVRRAASALIPSTHLAEQYFRRSWNGACRISQIYLGRDLSKFRPRLNESEREIPELGADSIEADTLRVLFVGRLTREKGLDVLLAAYQSLSKRYPNLRLWIAGDGPLRDFVTSYASSDTGIKYLGIVRPPLLYRLYRSCDLFCLPCRKVTRFGMTVWVEDYGHAVVEAMASGLPVVVGNCGALPELVADDAQIVLRDDARSLCESLEFALTKWKLPDVGARNRARTESRFNAILTAEAMRKMLDSVG
jgi:glycosyltransferase involved in cell wall biosynthesis